MKKLIKIEEVGNEGLVGLMGERITIFSLNYIYTGILIGVNDEFCKLESAAIVYETGKFNEPDWKDAQLLPKPVYVMLRCIEMFTILKD